MLVTLTVVFIFTQAFFQGFVKKVQWRYMLMLLQSILVFFTLHSQICIIQLLQHLFFNILDTLAPFNELNLSNWAASKRFILKPHTR